MLLIKTQRDMLLSPLQFVSGIVEKRHTLPITLNGYKKLTLDKQQAIHV